MLFVACCLLRDVCWELNAERRLLIGVYSCLLPLLCNGCNIMFVGVVPCVLFVVCCLLRVARCLLLVV